jgi:hypothetical protein
MRTSLGDSRQGGTVPVCDPKSGVKHPDTARLGISALNQNVSNSKEASLLVSEKVNEERAEDVASTLSLLSQNLLCENDSSF